ncbi:hypothetical protein PIB30_086409 [Stylosanthes scabra]|uniref:Secreted protein n=1 Tax=Stylosanthes scabra TaxID=79078 RepID=A0ABU6XR23_9FABA|nr:hypothetical protein [Stylosanthes scabra]
MASKLTPFLLSVAFRDQQLRSSAHFNPWLRHKALLRPGCLRTAQAWMRTHCLAYAYASAPLCVSPKFDGCARTELLVCMHLCWRCACAPLLQCVRMGGSFGLQAFLHDFFVPHALFSHFRSDLSLLKPETLE